MTVIDVVEPRMYVSEGGSSSGVDSSAIPTVFGVLLALAGAEAVLLFMGQATPPEGPTLSAYISKFSNELAAPAAVEEVVVFEASVAPSLVVEVPAAVEPEVEAVTVVEAVAVPEVEEVVVVEAAVVVPEVEEVTVVEAAAEPEAEVAAAETTEAAPAADVAATETPAEAE